MSGDFDPYREWLDIPPADQPPNYYRLLGLSLYESDCAAIARAAEERCARCSRIWNRNTSPTPNDC